MPYNYFAHTFLLACGYSYSHEKGNWEDIGNAETGPNVVGHHSMDIYTSEDDIVIIDERGNAEIDEEWGAEQRAYEEMMKGW